MIVYICGPITGKPNGNIDAFNFAQEQLLRMGHHPLNPHNICREVVAMHEGTDEELWRKCMKRDIPEMLKADAVLLLDGWRLSKGAVVERNLAVELGITVYFPYQLHMLAPLPDRPTREPERPSTLTDISV